MVSENLSCLLHSLSHSKESCLMVKMELKGKLTGGSMQIFTD